MFLERWLWQIFGDVDKVNFVADQGPGNVPGCTPYWPFPVRDLPSIWSGTV